MRRLALALALCIAAPAQAKTARELSYSYDRVWPALVRFLRVDEKLKITEKSEDSGYVLFELAEGKRTFPGAAELSKLVEPSGRPAVRISIKIEDRPSYVELGILERLSEKLRDELGEPPPPPPSPAAPDAPPEDKK